MKELHITMLGPRGVGKTSLLASMYDRFDDTASNIGLKLTPDLESSAIFQKRLAELKNQAQTFDATGGISGTAEAQQFTFGLGKRGSQSSLQLVFHDYPGGYLDDRSKLAEVAHYIENSHVIMLAIDTPAMMEQGGRWHQQVNRIRQITDFFGHAMQGIKSRKLVLFVPIKCESYVQTEEHCISLRHAVKRNYNSLLSDLAFLSDRIAVAITPVQTLGNVRFQLIEIKNDYPHFQFHQVHPKYAPRDVDQPLRYALSFVLHEYLMQRSILRVVADVLFQFDRDFLNALQTLGEGRKEGLRGYEILQGKLFLSVA